MDFSIILACDINNGIAKTDSSNTIPWKINDDILFFKNTTKNVDNINENFINAIIMGKNTADTFQKPLSDRINIVISSKNNYRNEQGFITYHSLDEALEKLSKDKNINKVFVIGGNILASQAIKHKRCKCIYLNTIDHNYNCDIKLSSEFINTLNSDNYQKTNSTIVSFCKILHKNINLTFNEYVYINREEEAYINMLQKIIVSGNQRDTRNGSTMSIFGERLIFNMSNGFPLLTTKKMFHRGIFEELLFFLKGHTDTKKLEEKNVMIWHDNTTKEFIKKNGKNLNEYDMGPMYGFQWRYFNAPYYGSDKKYDSQGIDQLKILVETIINDPHSRRMLMTTYNPAQVDQGVLYPCHGLVIQFYVEKSNKLSLQMYQRSVDSILGLPFNIASYAALLHIIVNLVNNNPSRTHKIDYTPGHIIIIMGDTHIYSDEKANHIETAKTLIKRKNSTYPFPELQIRKKLKTLDDLNDLQASDLEIIDYVSNKIVKAKMIA